ncbi:MAG TPA: methyltransferase domain-containing protein [Ktedonobacteraceae bacterium]|nr:methyltransferase domain-containing protein [Ktedonobacteraceae bacterium]
MSHLFYSMTMPGLETLAFSEVRARVPDAKLVKFARGMALFEAKEPDELLELRTVEDVFSCLTHVKGLRYGPDALRVIHSATLNANITSALTLWRRVHMGAQPKTWRVVSQMSGAYNFRRKDAGQTVGDALRRAMPRTLHQVEDHADLEFWLWLNDHEMLLGLRLSEAAMRHRLYKREHLPASLRPTVASAMSWLSRPTPEDIVLDPLCGAGTIIIERALLAPYDRLIGGDIRDEAVAMARKNARSAEVIATWRSWDARALPLDKASVTRIITNLPFGKQIGAPEENERLYAAVIHEFERVLSPDGLMVTLTSEDRLWEGNLRDHGWRIAKKVVCVVLGQPASIFVAERA